MVTMINHEIRASDTARYFGLDDLEGEIGLGGVRLMADETAAERALAHLYEVSPDMRGGAILSAEGSVLAASGEAERWASAAKRLLEAADRAGAEPAQQLHVATEEGEVFALRAGGLAAVTVTERFALASLMTFDIRAVLRDLSGTPEKAGGS